MNQPTQTKTAEQGHDLVETLRRGTKFLGHPSAVGTLSFMNLCNGFAYGGMSAVLIYFLYKPAPEGLGFTQAEASQLISLYSTAAADGNGANTGDYKNPDFDALLAKGNAESSTDAAIKDYQAAEEILLQDLPTVPLFYTNANGVANKDLKNFEFNWQNSPLYRDMTKQ